MKSFTSALSPFFWLRAGPPQTTNNETGLIQLTGKDNFDKVGKLVGMKLKENPELARQPDSALAIAVGFWIKNNISAVAGGSTAADVKAAFRPDGLGAVVNSSRSVTFPFHPDDSAWEIKVAAAAERAAAELRR